jgi:hypothetical protein
MGFFGSLIKAAITVVETPVAMVKDVVTLGGAITDRDISYTEEKFLELGEDVEDIKDEASKL